MDTFNDILQGNVSLIYTCVTYDSSPHIQRYIVCRPHRYFYIICGNRSYVCESLNSTHLSYGSQNEFITVGRLFPNTNTTTRLAASRGGFAMRICPIRRMTGARGATGLDEAKAGRTLSEQGCPLV